MIDRFVVGRSDFVAVRASQVIGEARQNSDPTFLRRLSTNELSRSQELLVTGLSQLWTKYTDSSIILDAHAIIDGDSQAFEVPRSVFVKLAPKVIIHIFDAPERIFQRRLNDRGRNRPIRSIQELRAQQGRSLELAEEHAKAVDCPFRQVSAGDDAGFCRAITQFSLNQ
jgi:adenylate kinase